MRWRKSVIFGACVMVAAACGGESFSGGGGGGESGSSSGDAGSSSGDAGAVGSAGAGAMGGSAGSASTAGSAGAGGIDCRAVDCAFPICADGAKPVTKPGECCPTCPPSSLGCEDVKCQAVSECPAGYELEQPEGACCEGCVPKPGGVACLELACPPDKTCPAGYVRGDIVGGCCYDCVPDPLYCRDDEDCLVAERPRACCGCPEPISRRMYDADECWNDVSAPRTLPPECSPTAICDVVCGACPEPGPVTCAEHRCALGMPR